MKKCELCEKLIKKCISFIGHASLGYGVHKCACEECYKEYIKLRGSQNVKT